MPSAASAPSASLYNKERFSHEIGRLFRREFDARELSVMAQP